MTLIHFGCPACGKPCRVPAEAAGRSGKCPSCGRLIQVPIPAAPAPPPPTPSAPLPDETLLAQVRAASATWKDRLADRTRRNRLLYFRPTVRTTLRILPPIDDLFDSLLDEARVPMEQLATEPSNEQAILTMKTLRARSREFEEERGVNPLFAVFGFLEWSTSLHPDVPCSTPVILVPVRLALSGRRKFVLEGTDEPLRLNPLLEQQLREDVGIRVELPDLEEETEIEAAPEEAAPTVPATPPPSNLSRLLEAVESKLPRDRGWSIRREACLGLLAYQKMVIVKDIEAHEREIAANPILAGLVGDLRAFRSRQAAVPVVRPEDLDSIPPDRSWQVLDADSSQQQCVEMAKRGASFVIQGPPGTGKSQTISNVIAELVGAGKKVLFVSEKRAALEVVFNRLKARGLEHLCLDLHASRADRQQVYARFRETLEEIRTARPADGQETFRRLEEERQALNAYAAALGKKRAPLGSTLYEAYGRVLANAVLPDLRFRVANLPAWTPERIEKGERLLESLRVLRERLDAAKDSPYLRTPWAQDRPPERMRERLGAMRDAIEDALASDARALLGLPADESRDGFDSLVLLLTHLEGCPVLPVEWMGNDPSALRREFEAFGARVQTHRADERRLYERFQPSVLDLDLDALVPRFQAWAGAWWRFLLPLSGPFRRDRAAVLAHARPGRSPGVVDLAADLALAKKVRDGRRALAGASAAGSFQRWYTGPASPLEPMSLAVEVYALVVQALELAGVKAPTSAIQDLLTGRTPRGVCTDRAEKLREIRTRIREGEELLRAILPTDAVAPARSLREMAAVAERAEREVGVLSDVLEERVVARELSALGLRDLAAELVRRSVPGSLWTACLRQAVDRTLIEGALANEPELRGFDPSLHLKRVEAFQKADVNQLDLAVLRLRREHAERATRVMNAFPEEERTLKGQIHRKRGGLHVRQLLSAAPNVLLSLRPCWMMSPLSVTQFVDLEAAKFDCVLFDEASQLLPEDVVPALLRADQAIVAGDSRQLPPTPFFRHVGEDEEEDDEPAIVAGYESILEQVSIFLPSCWLSWHYRSRDESLIAFSNHHIYEKRLLTFPDPRIEEEYGIQHILLTDAVYTAGSRRGNPREAQEVVARMLEHARRRPDESLGVIALGIQHQRAIQERLEAALELEENADVAGFFAEEATEPVFVKNLESVQGDERDAIILSVGYGPDAEGKVSLHFGPLNVEGGERRLNVAITRGRKRMTLVTSFPPAALSTERSSAAGLKLLREYIEYAASRGRVLGGAVLGSENPPERSVEMDVYGELVRAGYAPVCRMGASACRVDFAVPYPTNPGLFAIGIECDGPSYHGSPTARDRDRLRQEVLEQLGWRLHRVWSTAWVRDKARERERLLGAVKAAIQTLPLVEPTEPPAASPSPASAPPAPQAAPAREGTRIFTQKGPPLKGRTIDDYSIADLVQIVRWVGRDGQLRTDAEIEELVFRYLQFKRRGPRILAQIRRAIEWAKSP